MSVTSVEIIKVWLKQAEKKGCTHLMVVCDDFDHSDYPVYIMPAMNVTKEYENKHRKNMSRVMEIYNLSMDIEKQLKEYRAVHFWREKK